MADADAHHREDLQRHQGEAGHQVEVEVDQLVEGVLGLPGGTLFVFNHDLGGIARRRCRPVPV